MYNDPCLEKARNSIEKPPPGVPQGVIIPGSEKDGRTGVYRHWRAAEGELLKTLDPEVRV
jgi:long-chain acyl-CoA synthetase